MKSSFKFFQKLSKCVFGEDFKLENEVPPVGVFLFRQ